MRNKLTALLFLAGVILTSSCGTAGVYSTSFYDDGIYYRTSPQERERVVVATEKARAELKKTDEYVAKDEDGGLWLITEDGQGTYASRLHRFDRPFYTFSFNFGFWADPWFNPYWRWCDPWYRPWPYDPWYRPWPYDPWYRPWPYDPWYRPWPYDPWPYRPWPSPVIPVNRNVVYTPRTSGNSGIMRTGSSGFSYGSSPRTGSQTGTVGTRRSNGTSYTGGSGVTRTTNTRRNSSSGVTRTSRSSESSTYRSSRPSSSGYSGGGYSGGGYSGGGYSGGSPGTGSGTHSGGGRR